MSRQRQIASRFDAAAARYDAHSAAQRHAAARLADLIVAGGLPPRPRVLEIGCGTGHLTQALISRTASADFLGGDSLSGDPFSRDMFVSDISPAMVAACRRNLPGPCYFVMDGERLALAAAGEIPGGGFDLVCANLVVQWFADLPTSIGRLAALLAPGGLLALSLLGAETFHEWRAAHAALGLGAGTPDFPAVAAVRRAFAAGELTLIEERHIEHTATPLDLPRQLRAIGADTPTLGHRPLTAGELRRVGRLLGENSGGKSAHTYHLLYALCRVSV